MCDPYSNMGYKYEDFRKCGRQPRTPASPGPARRDHRAVLSWHPGPDHRPHHCCKPQRPARNRRPADQTARCRPDRGADRRPDQERVALLGQRATCLVLVAPPDDPRTAPRLPHGSLGLTRCLGCLDAALHGGGGATSWIGSILDLETGRTTAVLCKCHKATPSNHIARCPMRPKRSYQRNTWASTTGAGMR